MTKVFSTNTIGQTIDQWKSSGARWQASKLAKCMISKKTMTLTYSKCNKFLESFGDVFENLISLRFSSSVSNWFIFWTEITKNWHWGNDAICLARKFMSDPIMKCLWWIFPWSGSGPGPVLVRGFLNEILIWHWTRSQLLELYTPGTVSKTND